MIEETESTVQTRTKLETALRERFTRLAQNLKHDTSSGVGVKKTALISTIRNSTTYCMIVDHNFLKVTSCMSALMARSRYMFEKPCTWLQGVLITITREMQPTS